MGRIRRSSGFVDVLGTSGGWGFIPCGSLEYQVGMTSNHVTQVFFDQNVTQWAFSTRVERIYNPPVPVKIGIQNPFFPGNIIDESFPVMVGIGDSIELSVSTIKFGAGGIQPVVMSGGNIGLFNNQLSGFSIA